MTGRLHDAVISTTQPLTGEVVVEESECPVKVGQEVCLVCMCDWSVGLIDCRHAICHVVSSVKCPAYETGRGLHRNTRKITHQNKAEGDTMFDGGGK